MDQKFVYKYKMALAKVANTPMIIVNGMPVSQPQKKPGFFRRVVLPGAALVGGGLLADKYLNNSKFTNTGLNWLSDRANTGLNWLSDRATMPTAEHKQAARDAILKNQIRAVQNSFNADQQIKNLSRFEAAGNALAGPLGVIGVATGIGGLAVPGGAALATKIPKLQKILGSPASKVPPGSAASGLFKYLPHVGKIFLPAAVATDASFGWQLGQHPLVNEGWTEPVNKWWNPASWFHDPNSPRDPETTRKILSSTGAALGGASGVGKLSPVGFLGWMAAPVTKGIVDLREEQLRQAEAVTGYNHNAMDLLSKFYRAANKGDFSQQIAARSWIQRWMEANQGDKQMIEENPAFANLLSRVQKMTPQTRF